MNAHTMQRKHVCLYMYNVYILKYFTHLRASMMEHNHLVGTIDPGVHSLQA